MPTLELLAILAVALLFAKILAGLFEKAAIPGVLAELVIGVVIGNLAWATGRSDWTWLMSFQSSEVLKTFSELGALILLFNVGLETDLVRIRKVGADATLAAIFGIIAPCVLALIALEFVGSNHSFNHILFISAALAATSVGITARVLKDANQLTSTSGQIILGAAVIDDVLGILILTVVTALVTRGTVHVTDLAILAVKIFAFAMGIVIFRNLLLPFFLRRFRALETSGTLTVLLLALALVMAWFAELAGLAGIVGAFAVGLALDGVAFKDFREFKTHHLEEFLKPVADFFVPIFFIVMGTQVQLGAISGGETLILSLVLVVCAILGKLACGFALRESSLRSGGDRLLVGLGMIPRGEVGLIFAAMGRKLNVLGEGDFAAVVVMVSVTTFVAPFAISWRAKQLASL